MNRRRFGAVVSSFVAAMFLAGWAVAADPMKFEGKVFNVSEKSVTVGDENDQHSFLFTEQTRITLDGDEAKWSDLHEGDAATVYAEKRGEEWFATHIEAYAEK